MGNRSLLDGATLMTRRSSILQALLTGHQARWSAFRRAVDFVTSQQVPGDIVEFGVFAGASLALLAHAEASSGAEASRRVIGFDSFLGLPPTADRHGFCQEGAFRVNRWWHPTLPIGAAVTPQATMELFQRCGLREPAIHVGSFDWTVPRAVPQSIPQTAIVHVDCDLYESAKTALDGIAPALQEGTVLLFDDWFMYGGNPGRGEARALREFLQTHPQWAVQDYGSYGVFAKAFLLYQR